MRDAIAIDFDGCLCVNEYPRIGAPNWAVIAKAKERQAAGAVRMPENNYATSKCHQFIQQQFKETVGAIFCTSSHEMTEPTK